jgi:hypothetical protein
MVYQIFIFPWFESSCFHFSFLIFNNSLCAIRVLIEPIKLYHDMPPLHYSFEFRFNIQKGEKNVDYLAISFVKLKKQRILFIF